MASTSGSPSASIPGRRTAQTHTGFRNIVQDASGYTRRARAEVEVAAHALNRTLELGRPNYVRIT